MLVFITALICATAVLFSSFPAALHRANRIHIENGREPNAGIAFMPDLIVMGVLWCGVGAGLSYFFDQTTVLSTIVAVSGAMIIWQLYQARRSSRDYLQFLADHALRANQAKPEQKQAEQGGDGDAEEAV